jgi:hypothetical protein
MFCHTPVTELRPGHRASAPALRWDVGLVLRHGVRLEPDPATDPLGYLTLQLNRLTRGGRAALTDPCLGSPPWGSAPYSALP